MGKNEKKRQVRRFERHCDRYLKTREPNVGQENLLGNCCSSRPTRSCTTLKSHFGYFAQIQQIPQILPRLQNTKKETLRPDKPDRSSDRLVAALLRIGLEQAIVQFCDRRNLNRAIHLRDIASAPFLSFEYFGIQGCWGHHGPSAFLPRFSYRC